MFDQPPSLPMRAAIASLLGSCFGIAMIVFSHGAQAQAAGDSTARQVGDATLSALRGPEATLAAGSAGARGLRLSDGGSEPTVGLRLQSLPRQTLRSDADSARRASSPLTLGVQVRF